ncbi:hypothetical protein LB507_011631 [Fusarium sp. FIESC RH6]|nr:hypothetical protein LB507_011631 [Fusarium sp. FIESC RH6]
MDQRCSSKTVTELAQQDGPSVVAINSVHQLETLRQDLKGLPTKPPSIYLDASIVKQDELKDLQLLVPPTSTLYIIDIRNLGSTAMASLRDSGGSLRPILESSTIPKVGFDIRGLSRALFCHLNMSLDGMYDLQLMELASRDDKDSRKFLSGLANCINTDLPGSSVVEHRLLKMNDSTNKYLSSSLHRIARADSACLARPFGFIPRVWNLVSECKLPKKNTGKHGRQDWGPSSWWVREMKQAAIDDWEDDLRMELLAGDMELNDDAEWVLKPEEDDWDFEVMNWRGQI